MLAKVNFPISPFWFALLYHSWHSPRRHRCRKNRIRTKKETSCNRLQEQIVARWGHPVWDRQCLHWWVNIWMSNVHATPDQVFSSDLMSLELEFNIEKRTRRLPICWCRNCGITALRAERICLWIDYLISPSLEILTDFKIILKSHWLKNKTKVWPKTNVEVQLRTLEWLIRLSWWRTGEHLFLLKTRCYWKPIWSFITDKQPLQRHSHPPPPHHRHTFTESRVANNIHVYHMRLNR